MRHRRGQMCIGHGHMCMCICLSVCLSLVAFPHYCTDPDVTWRNGSGCPLVVHYCVDLQSMHEFHCHDNIAPNAKCQQVLVLAVWLVIIIIITIAVYVTNCIKRVGSILRNALCCDHPRHHHSQRRNTWRVSTTTD